jgi:hypothetical protein
VLRASFIGKGSGTMKVSFHPISVVESAARKENPNGSGCANLFAHPTVRQRGQFAVNSWP